MNSTQPSQVQDNRRARIIRQIFIFGCLWLVWEIVFAELPLYLGLILAFTFGNRWLARSQDRLKKENSLLQLELTEAKHREQQIRLESQSRQQLHEAERKIILRSIQELHSQLTPVFITSALERESLELTPVERSHLLEQSVGKQMRLLQSLQEVLQYTPAKATDKNRIELIPCLHSVYEKTRDMAGQLSVQVSMKLPENEGIRATPVGELEHALVLIIKHLLQFGEPHAELEIKLYAQPMRAHLHIKHSCYLNRQGFLHGFADGKTLSRERLALAVQFDVGLFTATRILESHQVGISIFEKSAIKQVTFALSLPLLELDDEEKQVAKKPKRLQMLWKPTKVFPKPKKLLLVEDDPLTQKLLQSLLTKNGIQVEISSNAQEAYQNFCEMKPDAVIADLGLPDSSGFDLMRRLRVAARYEFQAIAFSANIQKNIAESAQEAGFDTFLPKPLAIRDLCRILHISKA